MEDELLTPGVQYSVLGLALVLAGIIGWVVKKLVSIMCNQLAHIRAQLDNLPCGQHGEALKNLEKRLDRREADHQFQPR